MMAGKPPDPPDLIDVTTPEEEDEYIPSSLSLGLAWGGGNRIITNYNYRFAANLHSISNDDFDKFIEDLSSYSQEEQLHELIPEEDYDEEKYKNHTIVETIGLNVSDGGRIVQIKVSPALNDTLVISCLRHNEYGDLYVCDLIGGSDIMRIIDEFLIMFLMPDEFYIDNVTGDAFLIFLEDPDVE